MSEIELKFGVPADRVAAIDAALRRLPSSRRLQVESRYFDSEDGCLASAGLTLRLRRTGTVWEQTLKGLTDQVVERLEETIPRPGKWGQEGPSLDPALHEGTAAGKRLRTARGDGIQAPLRLVYSSAIVRRSVEIATGGARVEIAFDRGAIHAGAASTPVCELEYELKQGDARVLVELGHAGVREHGLWLSTVSKAARGVRLARGETRGPAVRAEAPRLDRAMSGPAIFQAVLQACLDQVLANAGEIVAGCRDAELIHQSRVGLRRVRTAWRELGSLAGHGQEAGWLVPLTEAFRALGDYRDSHTVVTSLQARLAEAGSPEPTLQPATDHVTDPVEVARAQAFQCALLDVLGLTFAASQGDAAGAERAAASKGEALATIEARLGKLHKQLVRGARTFERADPDAQHQARKRLKRLRYLAELVATLYKPVRVERYLATLRPAQDALGAHIDLVVGLGMARDAAGSGDAQAWFNVGWLTAQLATSVRRCRKALALAAEARPFWKR